MIIIMMAATAVVTITIIAARIITHLILGDQLTVPV
jgi:hypothetical protein